MFRMAHTARTLFANNPARWLPVTYDRDASYILGYRAVQDKVPNASGVYTIYTPRRSVYVGHSDDIRQSLFQHLNEPKTCMAGWGPLSFAFETATPAARQSRHRVLVTALRPACNAKEGS
jgi:hypothetical protein